MIDGRVVQLTAAVDRRSYIVGGSGIGNRGSEIDVVRSGDSAIRAI